MKRVEIITNSALEEDIREILEHQESEVFFSKINNVHGVGSSGPRRGDHIWPEENTIYIVYCEDEVALALEKSINFMKQKFTNEGLKVFIL